VSHIVDRRLNGRNRSASNRERFMRRYKAQIKKAVADMVGERSITDMEKGGDINIPVKDIAEPSFRHGRGGDRDTVLPGNREYVPGDLIPRPSGQSGAGGSEPGRGESMDNFTFALSREEFMNLFFDDLELPNLVDQQFGELERKKYVRAGFTTEGVQHNLALLRTFRAALGRKIAMGGVLRARQNELHARLGELADVTSESAVALREEIAALQRRIALIPFLSDIDLRFRNRVALPQPITRAVMFCLMDVSASMDENKKDLAKRFFTLLYMFLTRKYEHVELVFIRHTDSAEEVDEQRFFYDQKSGGTVVLSALRLATQVMRARFVGAGWNIYAAQASDGDTFGNDTTESAQYLDRELLPLTRHFAFVEIPDHPNANPSRLWHKYQRCAAPQFAMRRVCERREIYPVFRELFSKKTP
jgi:uncharacterized sporulation protein YeaH/YhbH (DUF444 family)